METENDRAILAFEQGATPVKVVREGDLASFGPGDERALLGLSMLDGTMSDLAGGAQLSEDGHLASVANRPDGTHAIVVATLSRSLLL